MHARSLFFTVVGAYGALVACNSILGNETGRSGFPDGGASGTSASSGGTSGTSASSSGASNSSSSGSSGSEDGSFSSASSASSASSSGAACSCDADAGGQCAACPTAIGALVFAASEIAATENTLFVLGPVAISLYSLEQSGVLGVGTVQHVGSFSGIASADPGTGLGADGAYAVAGGHLQFCTSEACADVEDTPTTTRYVHSGTNGVVVETEDEVGRVLSSSTYTVLGLAPQTPNVLAVGTETVLIPIVGAMDLVELARVGYGTHVDPDAIPPLEPEIALEPAAMTANQSFVFIAPCGPVAICAIDYGPAQTLFPAETRLETTPDASPVTRMWIDGDALFFSTASNAYFCKASECDPTPFGSGPLLSFTRSSQWIYVLVGTTVYRMPRIR